MSLNTSDSRFSWRLWPQSTLGNVVSSANKYRDACDLHQEALECQKKSGSEEIKTRAVMVQNLSRSYYTLGLYTESLTMADEALAMTTDKAMIAL